MVENVYTNVICLYTYAGLINSSRDFTITINNYNNTLKSAVYVTGNYRADGNRTLITHYTPSLTKTFTQLNSGVIKLERSASTVGYEFILFKLGISTAIINVYPNSSPYGFNEYGVVGTGNNSGESEIINYTNSHSKITFKCKSCNSEFQLAKALDSIKNNWRGCPYCNPDKKGKFQQ